ncbi:sarcosine oxidase subunit gamma [Roseovarius faecimaris]|uniref:Sarcosine oxidase subunit gamma n=1 Tax=Roseovarius faecimaris TaxID=2494550 RepID=A0A6I6ITH8_9RHOB|nr:sarcosine oxidase subunit gamma family protein [Roseovarius faecimaris]QGX98787.1 sarcosine oxidase subunit gamma [Roseovarius faecimaris]
MSEAVAPLNGAKYEGFVSLRAMGLQGMITLRGDLSDAKLKKAVKAATGQAVPAQRKIAHEGESGVAWMSPDELLLFVPYAEVDAKLTELHEALAGTHFLAVNVSDARAMFHLDGAGVREVMAKISPVDMSAAAFGPGDFRRSRMAQVPAAFWMPTDTSVQVVCFRSVSDYAFNLLKTSAEPGGEVGYF